MALPDEVESRLVERLIARDERAFTEFLRLYERRIYALVLRMIGNPAEAEELAQDVFVQVFKAIGNFRGESKLSTWVYRIAVNLCKNRGKYLKVRHADKQDEFDDASERAPAQVSRGQGMERPDEAALGRETEAVVRAAILELEPSFRECLVLRDIEELSYEEIEEITGLALGTVKSRIHRARRELREKVEAKLGEKIP